MKNSVLNPVDFTTVAIVNWLEIAASQIAWIDIRSASRPITGATS
jgi:hypothetical protein